MALLVTKIPDPTLGVEGETCIIAEVLRSATSSGTGLNGSVAQSSKQVDIVYQGLLAYTVGRHRRPKGRKSWEYARVDGSWECPETRTRQRKISNTTLIRRGHPEFGVGIFVSVCRRLQVVSCPRLQSRWLRAGHTVLRTTRFATQKIWTSGKHEYGLTSASRAVKHKAWGFMKIPRLWAAENCVLGYVRAIARSDALDLQLRDGGLHVAVCEARRSKIVFLQPGAGRPRG